MSIDLVGILRFDLPASNRCPLAAPLALPDARVDPRARQVFYASCLDLRHRLVWFGEALTIVNLRELRVPLARTLSAATLHVVMFLDAGLKGVYILKLFVLGRRAFMFGSTRLFGQGQPVHVIATSFLGVLFVCLIWTM